LHEVEEWTRQDKKNTNDKEHSKWTLGVLGFGEEIRAKSERESNLCRGIKVCAQNMPELP
jgi:hypothetical protein